MPPSIHNDPEPTGKILRAIAHFAYQRREQHPPPSDCFVEVEKRIELIMSYLNIEKARCKSPSR
jgi:LytS/YehU family sensor histidine kinase